MRYRYRKDMEKADRQLAALADGIVRLQKEAERIRKESRTAGEKDMYQKGGQHAD